jgi:hypothetical protein
MDGRAWVRKDAADGNADDARETIVTSGAGSTPIVPSRNCGPCGASHIIRQVGPVRAESPRDEAACPAEALSEGRCSGHSPGGCAPAGQHSASSAATLPTLCPPFRGQHAEIGAVNNSASWSTVKARAPDARRRRMADISGLIDIVPRELRRAQAFTGSVKVGCAVRFPDRRIIPVFLASHPVPRAPHQPDCRIRTHKKAVAAVVYRSRFPSKIQGSSAVIQKSEQVPP